MLIRSHNLADWYETYLDKLSGSYYLKLQINYFQAKPLLENGLTMQWRDMKDDMTANKRGKAMWGEWLKLILLVESYALMKEFDLCSRDRL